MSISAGQRSIQVLVLLLDQPDGPFELERSPNQLRITPKGPNTFSVLVADDDGQALVQACSWHEHFDDADQAGGCVMGLFCPYYRIVEQLDGGQVVWSHIERYQAEGWVQIGAGVGPLEPWQQSGQLISRTGTRQIHQQAVIGPPFPWEERFPGVVLDGDMLPPKSILGTSFETD